MTILVINVQSDKATTMKLAFPTTTTSNNRRQQQPITFFDEDMSYGVMGGRVKSLSKKFFRGRKSHG